MLAVAAYTMLELLAFANKLCCEGLKVACDNKLASMVRGVDEALSLNADARRHMSGCTNYQERSVYCLGKEKMAGLQTTMDLDPTLTCPYKLDQTYTRIADSQQQENLAGSGDETYEEGCVLVTD
jgi:hypothetical protein